MHFTRRRFRMDIFCTLMCKIFSTRYPEIVLIRRIHDDANFAAAMRLFGVVILRVSRSSLSSGRLLTHMKKIVDDVTNRKLHGVIVILTLLQKEKLDEFS